MMISKVRFAASGGADKEMKKEANAGGKEYFKLRSDKRF
jgi:hypothetical protein